MAVEFKDDRFVVSFITRSNPIEEWLGLCDELFMLLSLADLSNLNQPPYLIYELLRYMMPEWNVALKMHPLKKQEQE